MRTAMVEYHTEVEYHIGLQVLTSRASLLLWIRHYHNLLSAGFSSRRYPKLSCMYKPAVDEDDKISTRRPPSH